MGFLTLLPQAASWLLATRASDNGWGVAHGQGTSLVNTAEALSILYLARVPRDECTNSLIYITDNLDLHLKTRGPRTRFVARPLMTLRNYYGDFNPDFQMRLAGVLAESQNSDGGWGGDLNGASSDVFSTYIAVEALKSLEDRQASVAKAAKWVLETHQASGWPLHAGQPPSIVATAYSLQILRAGGVYQTDQYRAGRDFLIGGIGHGLENDVIAGSQWMHCMDSSRIMALVPDLDILHPTIAASIRSLNKRAIEGKGWGEADFSVEPTVRSQYWAIQGLFCVAERFDISVQIPKISAEHNQGVLVEPQFMPFFVGTSYHTILPTRSFWFLVSAITVLALCLISGLYVDVSEHKRAMFFCGIALIAAVAMIIHKRPKRFPRISKYIGAVIVILAILHALFGISVSDAFKDIAVLVHRIASNDAQAEL